MTEEHDINCLTYLNTYAFKYPEYRRLYTYRVGMTLELAITDLSDDLLNDIAELHFTLRDKGSDISYPNLNYNAECINSIKRINDTKRCKRILSNLESSKHKLLIVSFITDRMRTSLESLNIPVLELGFQLLPMEYYQFYKNRNLTKHRKFLNKRTLKILHNKLLSAYMNIGLIPIKDTTKNRSYAYKYNNNLFSYVNSLFDSISNVVNSVSFLIKNTFSHVRLRFKSMFNSVLSIFSSVNSRCKQRLKVEGNHKLTEYGIDIKDKDVKNSENKSNKENIFLCYNCRKYHRCNLIEELTSLEDRLKDLKLKYYGFVIDPMNRDRTDIAREHKQVFLNMLDVKYKIEKCLNKRTYLHKNTRYCCFIEGDEE